MDGFPWSTCGHDHSIDKGRPSKSQTKHGKPVRKLVIAVLLTAILVNCSSVRQEDSRPLSTEYKVDETVYVCGCPMMCCNIISKDANGRCICNVPLKEGIVSRIDGHKVAVTVSGRGKNIFLANR